MDMRRSLVALRSRLIAERNSELIRAIELREHSEHWKAMYYTGLADGHNGIAKQLTAIIEGEVPDGLSTD